MKNNKNAFIYGQLQIVDNTTQEILTYPLNRVGVLKLTDHIIAGIENGDKRQQRYFNNVIENIVIITHYNYDETSYANDVRTTKRMYVLHNMSEYFVDKFGILSDIARRLFNFLQTEIDIWGIKTHLDQVEDYFNLKFFSTEGINFFNFKRDVSSRICEYKPKELLRPINDWSDNYISKAVWRQYIHKCDECGELYFDYNEISGSNFERYLPREMIGIDNMCRDCALNNDYVECRDCGELVSRDDATYIDDIDDYVCDSCLDNYFCCEECGEWHSYDDAIEVDGHYYCSESCARDAGYEQCDECGEWFNTDWGDGVYTEDGRNFCCDSCAESAGYHYSESNGAWIDYSDERDEIDEIVTGYHTHEYEWYGDNYSKFVKQKLGIGVELEVDGHSRYDCEPSFYEGLSDIIEDRVFYETDGSLNGGYENVSHVLTSKEFDRLNWERFCEKLVNEGFRSHDTDTCGLHFHFSSGYLGYNVNQIKNNAKKVAAFIQRHLSDIEAIARRKAGHWAEDYPFEITKETKFSDFEYQNRYKAVNMKNLLSEYGKSTIEIRICKGTLNPKTLRASKDFFLHIVANAKKISWKNLDNLNLWFKGIKPATKEYMQSRGAFVGAF